MQTSSIEFSTMNLQVGSVGFLISQILTVLSELALSIRKSSKNLIVLMLSLWPASIEIAAFLATSVIS